MKLINMYEDETGKKFEFLMDKNDLSKLSLTTKDLENILSNNSNDRRSIVFNAFVDELTEHFCQRYAIDICRVSLYIEDENKVYLVLEEVLDSIEDIENEIQEELERIDSFQKNFSNNRIELIVDRETQEILNSNIKYIKVKNFEDLKYIINIDIPCLKSLLHKTDNTYVLEFRNLDLNTSLFAYLSEFGDFIKKPTVLHTILEDNAIETLRGYFLY